METTATASTTTRSGRARSSERGAALVTILPRPASPAPDGPSDPDDGMRLVSRAPIAKTPVATLREWAEINMDSMPNTSIESFVVLESFAVLEGGRLGSGFEVHWQ